MYDILLQDSYTEWVVPLTLAIMWILSLQLFSIAHPSYERNNIESTRQSAVFIVPATRSERPLRIAEQLFKTVKRKECPDDPEGPHSSI
ncbi:hypothetical protein [Lederbergia lenta]|uniref:Uncharacterized protein n=2 Tax=Lederbergia lenta TaxID=1467 RepID=A0A2X4VKC9_LEDLE|nr:hypothetical protein [Lederbergia lenta]MCM3112498.1 hypothetical protein [Lederbergia lenta]MEC2323534.1 hypothetical protein [Lederbergia lenta]SQI52627.1 Uncharacterised protein [Lederbergia lenta]